MIDPLAAASAIASVVAGLVVLVSAVAGRFRRRAVLPSLVGLELLLVVQAVLAVVALADGDRPRELTTFLAYLAVSVLVLPATVLQARDDDRWSGVLVAVGLLVTAVVLVRAATTWRPA